MNDFWFDEIVVHRTGAVVFCQDGNEHRLVVPASKIQWIHVNWNPPRFAATLKVQVQDRSYPVVVHVEDGDDVNRYETQLIEVMS